MSAYGTGVLVVTDMIRKSPHPAVDKWASGRPLEFLFLSAAGEAELCHGVVGR